MKTQRFYPASAIKRLNCKNIAQLSPGEKAVFDFAVRKGLKIGIALVGAPTNPGVVRNASEKERVAAVLANCNNKISISKSQ